MGPGVSFIMHASSYEMYDRHGTVVAARTEQHGKGDNPFRVMETVSYHTLRNCPLKGKSFYSQRVADFVAQEVVIGEARHMHVPVQASEHTCLFYNDVSQSLGLGSFILLFSAFMIFTLASALAQHRNSLMPGCVLKYLTRGNNRRDSTSLATEMTVRTMSFAYTNVPAEDTGSSAYAEPASRITTVAVSLAHDGDDKFTYIPV
jgi:hypothetical protein